MRRLTIGIATLMVALCVSPLAAQQWGSVKGKFVFKGTAPTPAKANVNKDKEYCGKFDVIDDSLLVNADNNGIANCVVTLYLGRDKPPTPHPDYKAGETKVMLDNTQCRFEPHIAVLWTDNELVIGNKDTIGHNTKIDTFDNAPSNDTVPANSQLSKKFAKPERLPSKVSCSIHPWMVGYLVIKDHPYTAISNKDGEFELKNLPAGEWTLQFWQEAAGYLDGSSAGGNKIARRGLLKLKIEAGKTIDLGTIEVAASKFKK